MAYCIGLSTPNPTMDPPCGGGETNGQRVGVVSANRGLGKRTSHSRLPPTYTGGLTTDHVFTSGLGAGGVPAIASFRVVP